MPFAENLYQKAKFWVDHQADQLLFHKPKLYFATKLTLIIGIILQRILILTDNDLSDHTAFNISQLVGLPVLYIFEIALFVFIRRRSRFIKVADLLFGSFQLVIFEFLIALSLPISKFLENNLVYMLQQEILFLCIHTVIFITTCPVKAGLLFYVATIFLFRLSPTLPEIYYISWVVMAVAIVTSCLIILFSRDKIIAKHHKAMEDFSKLENIPHGLAILTKDKEVIFMNGVFKGILNLTNEKDALQKIMKMKRFESYPQETQQLLLQEIQAQMNSDSKSKLEEENAKEGNREGTPKNVSAFKRTKMKEAPAIVIKRASERNDLLQNTLNKTAQQGSFGTSIRENTENAHLLPTSPKNISQPMSEMEGSPMSNATKKKLGHLSTLQLESDKESQNTVEFSINTVISSLVVDTPRKKNNKRITLAQVAKSVVNRLSLRKAAQQSNKYMNSSFDLSDTKTQKIKAANRNSKGELRMLEITLSQLQMGNKDAIFVHLSDITSEMKARELQETIQYKDQLLKFVSHELRTPLNCSVISLNMLKPLLSNELILNYLAPALNSSLMLLNLVNDILDYSQIQARKLKIVICPWNLKLILNEVLTMMEMQASAKNIKLMLDWDPKIPNIYYTDGNRLKQILLNLLSNALKFTSEGSITIKGTYIQQKVCRIEVIDTGVGIAKENLDNLFKEFGKLQSNAHLNPQGVGLGLVISKLLSHELGFNNEGLQVKSELGVGTTFYFLLCSKYEGPESKNFEPTDLESSDDERLGPQAFMPKINNTPSSKLLAVPVKKPPALVKEGSARFSVKSKSACTNKNKAKDVDPFSYNFMHLYSKSTFSHMVPVITNVPVFPPSPALYAYKSRRLNHQTKLGIQRCLSTGTRNDLDEDNYSEEFAAALQRLNRTCKCQKILIVDDSAFNLTALKLLLKSFGIESIGVIDGERAIQEVLDHEGHNITCRNFSLIFMDVEMPGLNGFETAKALRAMMLSKDITYIPIIGVTGHNPQEKRVECLLSGMNDMIAKPVSPQLLQEVIYKWIMI